MSACERYEEMISALLDGELSAEEEASLRAHLAECPDCAAMFDAFAAIGDAVGAQDVPATLHDGIMEKVRAAEKASRTQGTIVRLRPILAAAACLIVLVGTVFALKNTLPFGRSAAKNASADASIAAAPSAVYSAGGAEAEIVYESEPVTEAAMSQTAVRNDAAITESKAASADSAGAAAVDIMMGAEKSNELPREVPEPTYDSGTETLCFTVRVEALTEDGFIGVVWDAGKQPRFAEGERVTVLTDGADMSVLKLSALLTVQIAADTEPEEEGVHALNIAPAE